MKIKTLMVLVGLVASSSAFADLNYTCSNTEGTLRVRARDNKVLVVSNPSLRAGNKTVATFSRSAKNLVSRDDNYVGTVDLRRIGTRRGGELLLGTRLNQLQEIEVDLILLEIEEFVAKVTLTKRDGDLVRARLTECDVD